MFPATWTQQWVCVCVCPCAHTYTYLLSSPFYIGDSTLYTKFYNLLFSLITIQSSLFLGMYLASFLFSAPLSLSAELGWRKGRNGGRQVLREGAGQGGRGQVGSQAGDGPLALNNRSVQAHGWTEPGRRLARRQETSSGQTRGSDGRWRTWTGWDWIFKIMD